MTNSKGKNKAQKRKNRSTGSTESDKSPEAKKQQVVMADKHEEAKSPEEIWKVLMNIQNHNKNLRRQSCHQRDEQ